MTSLPRNNANTDNEELISTTKSSLAKVQKKRGFYKEAISASSQNMVMYASVRACSGSLIQNFMCINEVMNDRPITPEMLGFGARGYNLLYKAFGDCTLPPEEMLNRQQLEVGQDIPIGTNW